MHWTRYNGHLDVAHWHFEVGTAEDIRTKTSGGMTPVYCACFKGHLDVAWWLFEVSAAKDTRTKNNDDFTPMYSACQEGPRCGSVAL